MKRFLFVTVLLILLISCEKTEIIKVSSSGKVNSVLVVVENELWQGEVGDTIRAVLAKDLIGFPQEEPRFNLSQISKRNFSTLLNISRSVVFIDLGAKNSFNILKDKYAAPQRVIAITATDKESLAALLHKHENTIVATFNESDIKTIQNSSLKKYWEPSTIETFKNLKVHIKIPYAYKKVQDTLNYIWFRKDIAEGYLNLQVYAIPIENNEFNGDNIITARNKIGKQFIPGDKEGMYLTTEDAFAPVQYNTIMFGKNTIETRGVWEMKNGFMAGPFLNYAILDEKNNRIIITEGFVYAPNIKKRDYLFELESLLKTLKFD